MNKAVERAAADRAPTRTQWAYDTLKTQIMDNTLAAGESYLEQDLALQLGISRTPLREAALRLAAEGFVTIRPRYGIQVNPISAADMAEVYDVLTLLEPRAAGLAAASKPDAARLEPMTAAMDAMEAAVAKADRRAWAEADRQFHAALIGLAGHRRIAGIVSTLWDQVHRARMATLSQRQDLSASNADHRALLGHIRAGKVAEAEALFRRHREGARKTLVALIEDRGEGGL